MFKKIIFIFLTVASLFSCPFDEDGNDPTVDAYLAIEEAISKDDFSQASSIAVQWDELYQYFEDTYKEPINTKLNDSIKAKDKKNVIHWLNRSMAIEIIELLDLAQKNIDKYQEARIYLVKVKKHLVVLEKKLDKNTAKKSKKILRLLLKTLGNPGMFGVGKKAKNPTKYLKYKNKIFEILDKNFPLITE